MINCVYEAKGRYGRQIIIDTVAGAKTARLEEIGAVRYKSYGVLAGTNKNLLRRLIEQLVLEGYLRVGDYQVPHGSRYANRFGGIPCFQS